MILDKIEKLLQEVSNLTAQNADEIEQLRLKYLSKKGEIAALMADFRNVSADQKKAVGMKINELKNMAIARINELKENTAAADDNADEDGAADLVRRKNAHDDHSDQRKEDRRLREISERQTV